jgi:thymidylate synthase (FAD)
MKFVEPKTYLIGVTGIIEDQLTEYLEDSGNEDFLENIKQAREERLSDGEILCSFYAKLCYKSLSLGQNQNVTKIRDIESNLIGCFDSGHGSVFEHCNLNFITKDCSRVFTHELVRHRVGTAFSQTSGRYVALDNIDFVHDPILDPVKDDLQEIVEFLEKKAKDIRLKMDVDNQNFSVKKKITSAIRRIAPNGQANEIGFSLNIRSLRHTLVLRTSEHAEYEIRKIFCQVGDLIEARWPLMLYGLNKVDTKDNLFSYIFN